MRVICYGDSNTWGYDPRSYFGDRYPADCCWVDILEQKTGWTVKNEGVNGREIPVKAVNISEETDLMIIMLGTNDLLQGSSAELAGKKMEVFLKNTLHKCGCLILIAPPFLKRGEWVSDQTVIRESLLLGKIYRDLAERLGVVFLDASNWNVPIAYDGVHFTEDGHRLFAEEILYYLRKTDVNY